MAEIVKGVDLRGADKQILRFDYMDDGSLRVGRAVGTDGDVVGDVLIAKPDDFFAAVALLKEHRPEGRE